MSEKIWSDINELKKHLIENFPDNKIYATSGGFDPLHVGHLRCIQETVKMSKDKYLHPTMYLGVNVIIVNGDGFLNRKKGYSFMPHNERMEIISGIEGVDFVVGWDDGTQTVTKALDILKPNYFTKGGDRTDSTNVPEFQLCEKIGCEVVFNVGGGKVQSSSKLVENGKSADINVMVGYAMGYSDGDENGRK